MLSSNMNLALITFILGLITVNLARGQSPWTKIGEIDVERAGFSNPYEHRSPADPTERYSLLLSSFNPIPLTPDYLFIYRHIGKDLGRLPGLLPQTLSTELTWPREPSQVPYDVFGFEAVAQPDGFIPPGKNYGALKVVDLRDWDLPVTHDIITTIDNFDQPWFYHRITWIDMDKDGLQDAFTCRANRNLDTGVTTTQMLWLKHPDVSEPLEQPWDVTVMNNFCDTFHIKQDISAGGRTYEVLITIGYFSERLMLHWTEDPQGRWIPGSINSRDIDVGGKYFDLKTSDLNRDGNLDLLVSWNAVVNGTLLAYEFPQDFRTGPFRRHVLKDGFSARSGVGGAGSPGACQPFYPTQDTSGRPWISLSGDDDGRYYVLRPLADDWQYDMQTLVDEGEGNIIGQPSVFDSNGNNNKELFVPSYFEDKIHVFRYAQSDEMNRA